MVRARTQATTEATATPETSEDDAGFGSLMMLTVGLLLLAATCAVGLLFQAHYARVKAAAAADAAALAGAAHLLDGAPLACVQALNLARENGALIIGCSAKDDELQVRGAYPLHGVLRRFGPMRASARARLTWQ